MPRNDKQPDDTSRQSPQQQLWLVADVAQYLRCSTDAVYRMVERSEIPCRRLFKRKGLRFHPEEIERWARSVRKTGGSEDN
jgi:excisionase family DNA binding protein